VAAAKESRQPEQFRKRSEAKWSVRGVANCAVIRNLIMLDRHYLAKLFYVRYQNTVITLIASCSETNASAKVCCCNSFQDVFLLSH
jgi:hypothetical protein